MTSFDNLPHGVPSNWRESKTQTTKTRRASNPKTSRVDESDALALVSDVIKTIGRKLELVDVDSDLDFYHAANAYLDQYTQEVASGRNPFSFLDEMVSARARYKNLTYGQVKGILNCLRADLERAARTPATSSPNVQDATPTTPDGYYTIVTETGEHVTLRLRTAIIHEGSDLKLPAGAQVASYLAGPDNESAYQRFAWVFGSKPQVWKRYREDSRIVRALSALLSGDYKEFGMAFALESNHCCRCGKRLTVPASINRGLGPDCAEAGW